MLLFILSTHFFAGSPVIAQTIDSIYKAAVGDTLLLRSGSILCDEYINFNLSTQHDLSNFTFRDTTTNGKILYYWIYFTPKVSGDFHGIVQFSWQCNGSQGYIGNQEYEFYCETPHDTSQIIFRPDIFKINLSVDTAKEFVYGKVQTTIHNYSGMQVVIDSVRYLGAGQNICSFFLDSVMSSKPKVIPAGLANDTLSIYLFSKQGPGLTVDAAARVYEHIGNSEHIDTLFFTFSSDPFFCCPQANFIGPFTGDGVLFETPSGTTLDSAITIVYTKFVVSFTIDSLKYPFSYTIEDKPLRKILHIHYHPLPHDTSSEDLAIHYYLRLFNGDTIQAFNGNRDNYFMFLSLGGVALTNDVKQDYLHDSAFRIVPNPAGKIITVSLTENQGSYDISIFSSTGSLVKTLSINSFPSQIDLSGLSSGNYYLEAKGKERSYHQKFIIE